MPPVFLIIHFIKLNLYLWRAGLPRAIKKKKKKKNTEEGEENDEFLQSHRRYIPARKQQ